MGVLLFCVFLKTGEGVLVFIGVDDRETEGEGVGEREGVDRTGLFVLILADTGGY